MISTAACKRDKRQAVLCDPPNSKCSNLMEVTAALTTGLRCSYMLVPNGWKTLLLSCLFHFLAQAQRAHVCPHFLDIRQAFFFCPGLARIPPTQSIFTMGGPDGILLLMVHNDFVNGLIFAIFGHSSYRYTVSQIIPVFDFSGIACNHTLLSLD